MTDLLPFLLAALALTGSPGPATLSVAASGAAFGARRSLGYLAGLWVGMVVVIAVTASGVTGLLLTIEGAAPVVALLGATYILYLAYRIATAPPLVQGAATGAPPAFLGGIFLQLVNPKAYAAMAALFSGFLLLPESPSLDAFLKATILLTLVLAVNLAWLQIGAALTRLFRNPATNRAINLAFAVLLVAAVAVALLL